MAAKPRTNNSIAEIAAFVSLGHSQSAANCRVLLDEIQRLNSLARNLNQQLNKANERAWGNEEAARELWEREAYERGRQGIYG